MHDSKSTRYINFLSRYSAPIALIILISYGIMLLPSFLTNMNLSAILYQYSVIGLLALGQLLVILTGGIDLSQGAMVAFTSTVTAILMSYFGLPIGVFGGLIITTGLGIISGLLVSRISMPPFIVTLGMMGIARGLAMQVANAKPIPISILTFTEFGQSTVLGVPVSAVIWAAICVFLFFFLYKRRLGRYIYAVGSSEESAHLSGVNVANVKLIVYTISAFLSAIAGIIWAARLCSGSPVGGNNYELESIAAVVVGGGNMFGGEGSVGGTVAGVLIFGVINSILNLSGVPPFWQGMSKGLIILLAVILSQVRRPGKV